MSDLFRILTTNDASLANDNTARPRAQRMPIMICYRHKTTLARWRTSLVHISSRMDPPPQLDWQKYGKMGVNPSGMYANVNTCLFLDIPSTRPELDTHGAPSYHHFNAALERGARLVVHDANAAAMNRLFLHSSCTTDRKHGRMQRNQLLYHTLSSWLSPGIGRLRSSASRWLCQRCTR